MTNNDHPITPPPDLQEQWKQEWLSVRPSLTSFHEWMLAKSSRWGYEQRGAVNEDELQKARDEELEACINAILEHPGFENPELFVELLRAARRPKPKPLSLKEQALQALDQADKGLNESEWQQRSDTIRRALNSLPD